MTAEAAAEVRALEEEEELEALEEEEEKEEEEEEGEEEREVALLYRLPHSSVMPLAFCSRARLLSRVSNGTTSSPWMRDVMRGRVCPGGTSAQALAKLLLTIAGLP